MERTLVPLLRLSLADETDACDVRFMTPYEGSRDQKFGHISYAQHGDDLLILNLFDQIGVRRPTYLDIGAHHPFTISNTALLYERGSRGINVEANPNLIQAFRDARPEDINVNVGVAGWRGRMPFYMHSPTAGRNTFDQAERDLWVAEGHPVIEVKDIEVVTVMDIVNQDAGGIWPHFLSLDAEGMDRAILESADFSRSSPQIICVEVRQDQVPAMKALLGTQNYFSLVRLCENTIFVRSDLKKKVR
jgi:FkbM family methyltransferase